MTECVHQDLLSVEAIQTGKEDVQDQAARALKRSMLEELLDGGQGDDAVVASHEQRGQVGPHPRLVVDYGDHRLQVCHKVIL